MFDKLKNLGQLTQVMAKAQKLQDAVKKMQEQLGSQRMTRDAQGRVFATVNGKMELMEIRIDKTKVDINNLEMLQDLIVVAVRDAQQAAAEHVKDEMDRIAAEIGVPPGLIPQS